MSGKTKTITVKRKGYKRRAHTRRLKSGKVVPIGASNVKATSYSKTSKSSIKKATKQIRKTSKSSRNSPKPEKTIGSTTVKIKRKIKRPKRKISQIVTPKTKPTFKEIVEIYQKEPDYIYEIGFGIDKEGNTTRLVFGDKASINVGGIAHSEFGEDLEYVVHTHPEIVEVEDYNVSERYFSVNDLLNADLFDYTPVLMYREKFSVNPTGKVGGRKDKINYIVKSLTNIPENRETIVSEYGKIHEEFEVAQNNWKQKYNITSAWDYIDLPKETLNKAEKEMLEIRKNTIKQFERIEKEYGLIQRKIFTRSFPKKPKGIR